MDSGVVGSFKALPKYRYFFLPKMSLFKVHFWQQFLRIWVKFCTKTKNKSSKLPSLKLSRYSEKARGSFSFPPTCNFCSDFRYESNGIFVLGVGFFLQTIFDFLTSHFWRNFFISIKRYCCLELNFEKIFHLWSFFVKLWGFKDCHFGHFDQFGTINARYNSRY